MGENLIQVSGINDNLVQTLKSLATQSFNVESSLYIKLLELDPEFETITGPSQLNAFVCRQIFETIVGGNNGLLEIFRDTNFYNSIRQEVNNTINNIVFTKSDLKNNAGNNNPNPLYSTQARAEINKLIGTSEATWKQKKITDSITKYFSTVISSVMSEKQLNGKFDIKIKGSKIDEKNHLMEIAINDNSNKDNTMQIRLQPNNKEIYWSKDDSIKFLKILQRTNKNNDIKLIGENLYEYNFLQGVDKNNLTNVLFEKLRTAILEYVDKKSPKNRNEIDSLIISLKEVIGECLNDKSFKSLFLGQRTKNQITGDFGEAFVVIFIKKVFKKGKFGFVGDVQTGYGQAAVDAFISKMGFQVKNFPSQESQDTINLYKTKSALWKKEAKSWDIEDDRYLNREEKYSILKNTWNGEEDSILHVLTGALPNFMRYSQNFKLNSETELIIKELEPMRNNFYILNFRVIPASRIFWELAGQAEKNSNPHININDVFYIANNEEDPNINGNLIRLDTTSSGKYNIFSKSVSVFFKGIPINYAGLKLNETGQNLLADSFPKNPFSRKVK